MMAYAHSFTERFYGDPYNPVRCDHPATVVDALASLTDDTWQRMSLDLFGCCDVDLELALTKILETDTVTSFQPPVEVWIDPDGYYTVEVHDTEGAA